MRYFYSFLNDNDYHVLQISLGTFFFIIQFSFNFLNETETKFNCKIKINKVI